MHHNAHPSHNPIINKQEVPKSLNRISSQTFYLLSHNRVRCVEKLTFKILKAIKNHMSRRKGTVSRHAKFLEKVCAAFTTFFFCFSHCPLRVCEELYHPGYFVDICLPLRRWRDRLGPLPVTEKLCCCTRTLPHGMFCFCAAICP